MADMTGHMDRPGAGPFCTNEALNGILTGYYTCENPESYAIEVVKSNPPGSPDAVVKEFTNKAEARQWLADEYVAGRLR